VEVLLSAVLRCAYSPRDKPVFYYEPRFFVSSNFFAVSSRFWGAESKSDECHTGTLEHFRQNLPSEDNF